MTVDTTNDWPNGGDGRPAVRIVSDNTYTHGLFILDLVHMPWGCGTWPAYWLVGPDWPYNGEIDIIEGVNTLLSDSMSLHTDSGCTITGSGQTGTFETPDCNANDNGNSGCGTSLDPANVPNNYGAGLNSIGGGVYATEWTSDYIKTWFFPRGGIPESITNGQPDVSTFGTPAVNAQGDCTIDDHFQNMSIVINTDFCGSWAGAVYGSFSDCPQNASRSSGWDSCVDFVGLNPSSFTDAYWEINYIKVYQMPAGAKASTPYTTSLSSVTPAASTAGTSGLPVGAMAATSTISSAPYSGPLSSASKTASAAASASTPAICPGSNNTVWTDANNQQYTIACGSDYQGGGAVQYTTSFEQCLEACDGVNGCFGVSFIGGNGGGSCYVKNAQSHFVYDGSTNGAARVAGPASVASSVSSTPSSSAMSSSLRSSAASSTSASSLLTSLSKAISSTSTGSSTAVCSNGAQTTDTSGVVYTLFTNSDTSGGAFASQNFLTGDLTQCEAFCDASSNCGAWTWAPGSHGGGACYLKHPPSTPTTGNAGYCAGILGSVSPAPSATATSAAAVCQNNTVQTDDQGVTYTIYCDSNTNGGAFASQGYASGDFTQCEPYCDAMQGCSTWVWGPYPDSGGICYAKQAPQTPTFSSGDVGYVAGFKASSVSSSSSIGTSTTITKSSTITSSSAGTLSNHNVIASSTASSMSSSVSPIASASCPSANNTQLTDSNGTNYTIYCSSDTSGGSFASQSFVTGDFTQCMDACDNQTSCAAWTWGSYPTTGGVCYFKDSSYPVAGQDDLVAGILVTVQAAMTKTSTTSHSSSSSVWSSSSLSSSIPSSSSAHAVSSTSSSVPSIMTSVQNPGASVARSSNMLPASSSNMMFTNGGTSTGMTSVASSSAVGVSSTGTMPPYMTTTPAISSTPAVGPSVYPSFSSAASGTPAPACPTSANDTCSSQNEQTECSSQDGSTYGLSCGVAYEGTILNPSSSKHERQTQEPTVQACTTLCDTTTDCVALNYNGTSCTMFSSVSGTYSAPGVVGAFQLSPPTTSTWASASATATATPLPPSYGTVPSCPGSADQMYTDSQGTSYGIGCNAAFTGNDIGTPISEASFTDCLPYCDSMSGCAGVEYDTTLGLCYLKSSFSGLQTSNTSVIHGTKGRAASGGTAIASATITITPSSTTTLCTRPHPSSNL